MHVSNFTPVSALIGGVLIGAAATLYLFTLGRYAGISGMVRSAVFPGDPDRPLDVMFLVGLVLGGIIWTALGHGGPHVTVPLWLVALGGLAVGAGTALGHGCTSGHGVCGLGRLSPVSLVAVVTFLATGIGTVFVVRHVVGLA